MASKPPFVGEKVKLGDICELLNGFAFKSSDYVDEGIRIIRIANVQKGYIEDIAPKFYPMSTEDKLSRYMLYEGDILVSLTGNVGRVGMLPKDMLPAALNQRVACLRLKDSRILKEFLYYFLNSNRFENDCISVSKGIAQKNLSTEWLKEYPVPLLSVHRQKRIIDSLYTVDNAIKICLAGLAAMDQLIKSRFVEMFGDPVTNSKWDSILLRDICCKLGSGATPKGGKAAYKESGIPLIRSMNVHNGRFEWKDLAYIDDEQAEKLKGVTLQKGDVLLNITGASVARSCVLPDELAGGRVNQHVAIIRPDCSIILSSILNEILINPSYQRFLLEGSRMAGATREAITKQDLQNISIPLLPMELQQQFADFVAQVDKSRFVVQQQIEKLQTLYDSLTQEYFGD